MRCNHRMLTFPSYCRRWTAGWKRAFRPDSRLEWNNGCRISWQLLFKRDTGEMSLRSSASHTIAPSCARPPAGRLKCVALAREPNDGVDSSELADINRGCNIPSNTRVVDRKRSRNSLLHQQELECVRTQTWLKELQ